MQEPSCPVTSKLNNVLRCFVIIGGLLTIVVGVYTLTQIHSALVCYLGVSFISCGALLATLTLKPQSRIVQQILNEAHCLGRPSGLAVLCMILGSEVLVTSEFVSRGFLLFFDGIYLLILGSVLGFYSLKT